MTRLIFVDEDLVVLLESDLAPAALVEMIQSGQWQPPAALRCGLAALRAVRLGRLVIAAPLEPYEILKGALPAETPTLELSPRQRQVLQGLADGLTIKQIAFQVGVHRRTVELHIEQIKRRFGTRSRMQSVLRGVALGLCKVKPEPNAASEFGYTRPIERSPTRPHPPRKTHEERTLPDSTDQ